MPASDSNVPESVRGVSTTRESDTETPDPLGRKRERFESSHGAYLTNLSDRLGNDRDQLVSLIARESMFDPRAKHREGSAGLTQLTSVAFDDLKVGGSGRAAKYSRLFRKLDGMLPPNAPAALRSLVGMSAGRENGSAAKWNQAVSNLRSNMLDPVVNLTVGSVLLSGMRDDFEATVANPTERDKRRAHSMLAALEHPKNLRRICAAMRELGHVGAASAPETVVAGIRAIREGIGSPESKTPLPREFADFLALRRYNGNMSPEAAGLRHRDVYAAIVLFSGRIEAARRSEKMAASGETGKAAPRGATNLPPPNGAPAELEIQPQNGRVAMRPGVASPEPPRTERVAMRPYEEAFSETA